MEEPYTLPDGNVMIQFSGGRFLAAELKTSVGKLSEAQLEQHPLIRAAGGDLATPRGVREFVAWLRSHRVPVVEEWHPQTRSD